MVKELGSHHSDRRERQGANAAKGKHTELHNFASSMLTEALSMKDHTAGPQHSFHPSQLVLAIQAWLGENSTSGLLKKFDNRLSTHGGERLSFDTIALYQLPVGRVFDSAWREQIQDNLTEENKKGFVLLLVDEFTKQCSGIEKTQWSDYLEKNNFPQRLDHFDSYDNHLGELTDLYHDFLSTLNQTRAEELMQHSRDIRLTNKQILDHFQRAGLYAQGIDTKQTLLSGRQRIKTSGSLQQETEISLVNLTEQLVSLELGDDMLGQAELLATTVQNSEKFLVDKHFGNGLFYSYPVEEFYETRVGADLLAQTTPTGHFSPETKQQLVQGYFDRIGQHDLQRAPLMKKLGVLLGDKKLSTLSLSEKKQLMDLYVESHLEYLIDDGLEHLLAGYGGGDARQQLHQYKQFRKSIYSLDQQEVVLPDQLVPAGQSGKIVFAKKDIVLPDSINEISDLSRLFQLDFVIDTDKTTLPTEFIFADAYERVDIPGQKPIAFKQGVAYTFTHTETGEQYENVVVTTPDRASVEMIVADEYESYLDGLLTEPGSIRSLPGHALGSWQREETNPNQRGRLRVTKSLAGLNKRDGYGFDRLNLTYLGLLTQVGTPGEHVSSELLIEQLLQYQTQSPAVTAEETIGQVQATLEGVQPRIGRENTLRRELFQAGFVADEDIPPAIRSQHPEGTAISAWVSKGKIFFNKDIFEQETGLSIGQDEKGNRTFDGQKISQWIANHQSVWQSTVKPLLKRRGTHEKMHRLLEFHGIAHNPSEVKPGSIAVTSLEGKTIALDHEAICKIADGSFEIVWDQDRSGSQIVKILLPDGEQYDLSLDHVEQEIAKIIPGFRFDRISKIDAQYLDEYLDHPEKFKELDATMSDYEYSREEYEEMDGSEKAGLVIGEDVEPEDEYLERKRREARSSGRTSSRSSASAPTFRRRPSRAEIMSEFMSRFNELAGDSQAGLQDGVIIMSKLRDSGLPGRASEWLERELSNTQGTGPIELILKGRTEGSAGDAKGKIKYVDRSVEGLNQMIADFKGQVYKFQPVHGQQQFRNYLKEGLDTKTSKIGGWQPAWSGEVFNNQFEKRYFKGDQECYDRVAYVGQVNQKITGTYKPTDVFYHVDMSDRGVRVSTLDGKFDQHMSWVSFMTFCLDKGLDPYTADEFESIDKITDPNPVQHKTGHWTDNRVSPIVVWQAIKKFPEAYKYKLEQQQKYESAKLYAQFADLIPEGWTVGYAGDIKADAISDLDSSISQVIEGYKKRLDRGDADQSVHGSKVAGIIETEIFQNMGSSTRFRQKAAGYLLYATQKGGGAYFRSLSNYAHTGIWVRAILGESHHQKFLHERDKMLDELRSSGVSNDDAMDKVAKAEVMYIAKETQDGRYEKIYGTRFGRWLEDEAAELGQGSAAKGISDGLLKKGNIYEIYDAFRGGGLNNLTSKMVAAGLLAMEQRVESMDHYSLFYKSIIQVIVSGYSYSLGTETRNIIKGICRRRGIPIGLFISDSLHTHKVVSIIDHIAQSGADGRSYPKLSDAIKAKAPGRNGKSLNAHNFAVGGQHKKVMGAIDSWRDNYGYTVMAAFNYKNTRLTSYVSESSGETKTYIDEYFNQCVFDSYKGRPDRQSDPGDGQSPFYQEGIFNVASGFFEDYMLRVDSDGTLRYSQTRDMWEEFGGIVGQFDSLLTRTADIEQKKFLLKFLLKKFKQYFGSRFSSKEYAELAEAFIVERPTDKDYVDASGADRIRRGYRSIVRGKLLGDYYLQDRERWDPSSRSIATRIGGARGRKGIEEGSVEAAIESMVSLFSTHTNGMNKAEIFSVLTD